jgi:hypothetical protein
VLEGLLGVIAGILSCILVQLIDNGKRARKDAEASWRLLDEIRKTISVRANETRLYRRDKRWNPAEKQASSEFWNKMRATPPQ